MEGYKEIWFPHATPKYAFITWLLIKNRLTTGERMLNWNQNVNSSCVFCDESIETRDHLFFQCPYSNKVWKDLVLGLLSENFKEIWYEILQPPGRNDWDKVKRFLLRYTFQNSIHSIWSERNRRRHGEQPTTTEMLVKTIDKNVRNRLSTIKGGGASQYEDGLQAWFASRP